MFAVDKRSTDRLPCPSAQTLRRLLPMYNDSAFFLADVAEVADAAGARGIEVALDANTYPARSLLLPQLAAFQGPAVTVKFTGAPCSPRKSRSSSPPRHRSSFEGGSSGSVTGS